MDLNNPVESLIKDTADLYSDMQAYDDIEAYIAERREKGLRVDVSGMIEKKGKFSYLSWPHSVKELHKLFPLATWTFEDFPDGDGLVTNVMDPRSYSGAFVRVKLQVHPLAPVVELDHPILDNHNKPVTNPSAFDVNTSRMRALSKVISIATGIGLSLYAGEDLPDDFVGGIEASTEDTEALKDLLDGPLGDRKLGNNSLREVYTKRLEKANWSRKEVAECLKTLRALS